MSAKPDTRKRSDEQKINQRRSGVPNRRVWKRQERDSIQVCKRACFALNKLGRITIERGDVNAVAYSADGVVLKIKKDSSDGASALTVAEIDGTPSISSVNTIRFPNGSVTNIGGGIAQVNFATGTVDVIVCSEGDEVTYRLFGSIV